MRLHVCTIYLSSLIWGPQLCYQTLSTTPQLRLPLNICWSGPRFNYSVSFWRQATLLCPQGPVTVTMQPCLPWHLSALGTICLFQHRIEKCGRILYYFTQGAADTMSGWASPSPTPCCPSPHLSAWQPQLWNSNICRHQKDILYTSSQVLTLWPFPPLDFEWPQQPGWKAWVLIHGTTSSI